MSADTEVVWSLSRTWSRLAPVVIQLLLIHSVYEQPVHKVSQQSK